MPVSGGTWRHVGFTDAEVFFVNRDNPLDRISLDQLASVRNASRVVTSLEKPVGAEGETELGELLAGGERSPEEEVEITLQTEAVRRAVASLPAVEREVVRLRYGIDGGDPPRKDRRCHCQ